MTPEEYRLRQAELSTQAGQRAVAAMVALEVMPEVEWSQMVARFINVANSTAATLADAFVSSLLRTRPLALPLPDETSRLTAALTSIVHDRGAMVRVDRLARSEPQAAARTTTSAVLEKNAVTEYRWILDADPCPECVALGARTWPISMPPVSHPQCKCQPVPVIN